ncbi:MAG: hypothetical protein HWN65_22065 [Candidatus Helarchaeota archaeon]|nr:hypothetical protein [Candidatus Helarchaeota archaeon]
MTNKLLWITEVTASKYQLTIPIDTRGIIGFLELEQNADGFYNTLEETFWASIGLEKLGTFQQSNRKQLISHIMKYRMSTGGYTSKLDGESPDIWSTFYALALLYLMGVFKERLIDEQLFCPECGQKQLYKMEKCFNCDAPLTPEKSPCVICNRVIQKSASKWSNLCQFCHDNFNEDIQFILTLQKKRGFVHCELDNCIICKGKPSYKTTFFAINALYILESVEKIDMKSLINFLDRNQYTLEIERIFQILCYYLIKSGEEINYLDLLQNMIPFQHKNSGFGVGKKVPVMSDTFWAVATFSLLKQLNLIHLGPIKSFLVGLKRNDGGYSEQIMDTISNILSTIQSYLITLTIFDPLVEQIEDDILKQSLSEYKIYLTPISERNSVSNDFVEGVAYQMLTKEWFPGKIIDQLEYFNDYLDQSNKITYDIGKSLIQIIQNQNPTELKLNEFSKRFDDAEERVKTVIIDFLVRKFLEGEIHKIKKHYIFQGIKLPRKFLALSLDKPIPVDKIFSEKAQILPKREEIEKNFQSLLDLPKSLEQEILRWLEVKEIGQARERLKLGKIEIMKEIENFEKSLTKIVSQFEYVDFEGIIIEFLEQWPVNKKALSTYMDKFQGKMNVLIKKKEHDKAHEEALSEEQRLIKNYEEYLNQVRDKVDLLTQNFKKTFQQNFKNHQLASTTINELNGNIEALIKDLSEKDSQFSESIELSQIPEIIIESKKLSDSIIESLKEISDEGKGILEVREKIPKKIEEDIKNYKDQLDNTQKLIKEKIENREFDSASAELEAQDEKINALKTTIAQNLEKLIGSSVAKISHFNVQFDEFRTSLNKKMKQVETEWLSKKEELLTRFHEKTELTKKNELETKVKKFIDTQTEKLDSLKEHIEILIKHENLSEAKSKLDAATSQFIQTSNQFETEINASIKEVSKQYKTFKKLVNNVVLNWEKEKNFILQSMQTLDGQLNNLSVEKDLLTQKNKLVLIIKNQKLLLTKDFSNLMKLYDNALEKSDVLNQEPTLLNTIKTIRALIIKANSQIDGFIKDNSKKFSDFTTIIEEELQSWQKTTTLIESVLQKIQNNLNENVLIERIYFVVKAFEGYRTDLKYLSKATNIKSSQLKDQLVYLLSSSRLEGNLDPINDNLTLSALKPISEETEAFLEEIKEGVGAVLEIDFERKEEIPKEIEDKKQYLLQLRYLLIIHRNMGTALFHRKLGTWEINPDLISGFLTAIGSFGSEIKSKSVPIRKMAYKEFEIILNQGELVVAALILDGNSSEWHELKLAEFTKEFEREFQENLKVWTGELTQFKSAGLMVDRVFELFRAYI